MVCIVLQKKMLLHTAKQITEPVALNRTLPHGNDRARSCLNAGMILTFIPHENLTKCEPSFVI